MSDLIAEFCGWHESYNQVSPQRARDRLRILRALEASYGPLASLGSQDLEKFLQGRRVAPATTLKDIKLLRPFWKWCWKNGHMDADRMMKLRGVQAPRGAGFAPPKPYSRHEIACFWEHFEEAFPWTYDPDIGQQTTRRGEFWTRRWQRGASDWRRVYPYARRLHAEAIVSLALFGGLRRDEIFRLTLEDGHYENKYIRVLGSRKNPERESHERAVPMTDPLRVALSNWWEFRAQVLNPPHESPWLCLWRENYLDPMSLTALSHLLDKVGDGYELHRMRHTFATERYKAGTPIEHLQKMMGHTSIKQTLQYAKISDEDVIRRAEMTNDQFAAAVVRSHTA